MNKIAAFLLAMAAISPSIANEPDQTDTMVAADSSSYNPIAVQGLESASLERLNQQRTSPYSSLDQLPPLEYLRKSAPRHSVPTAKGTYESALVPDTCNLEYRAGLVVNYFTESSCPDRNYEPYYGPSFALNPPRIPLDAGGGQLWPKYMEAMPLMRLMSGSRKDLQVDKAWADVILRSIAPDGGCYFPLVGRPWDAGIPTGTGATLETKNRGLHRGMISQHEGRMLGVISVYFKMTDDKVWLETGKRLVDRLSQLAVPVGDKAAFLENYYFPGDTVPPDAIKKATELASGSTLGWAQSLQWTWVVTGLSQFYEVSGYEPAKELAYRLVRVIRASYPADGKWYSHAHCGTLGIQAMAELAFAAGDRELGEFAAKCYEWAKNKQEMGAIESMGYFPVMQKRTRSGTEPMEPCAVADMIAIATRLTKMGIGDYYDDIDGFARNGLIESQITRPDQITDFTGKIRDGRAKGNAFWQPETVQDRPLAYSELSDRLPERLVGFFSSCVLPNDLLNFSWSDTCCTGNCARALYYAWESINDYKDGSLDVNILMNRTSPWADVDSYLPYTGRVDVKAKKSLELRLRIPRWLDMQKIDVSIGGKHVKPRTDGRFLAVGTVTQGQVVSMQFPLPTVIESVSSFDLKYEIRRRGADVVSISPQGGNVPTYQRIRYESATPAFLKMTRFSCDNPIEH